MPRSHNFSQHTNPISTLHLSEKTLSHSQLSSLLPLELRKEGEIPGEILAANTVDVLELYILPPPKEIRTAYTFIKQFVSNGTRVNNCACALNLIANNSMNTPPKAYSSYKSQDEINIKLTRVNKRAC